MFQVPINRRVYNINPYFNFNKFLVPNVFSVNKFGLYCQNFVDLTNRARHVDATWNDELTYFMM